MTGTCQASYGRLTGPARFSRLAGRVSARGTEPAAPR